MLVGHSHLWVPAVQHDLQNKIPILQLPLLNQFPYYQVSHLREFELHLFDLPLYAFGSPHICGNQLQ